MTTCEAVEALEQFCRSPWEFQQTFETPLKNLQPFVKTIVSVGERVESASLTIDQVVFEPRTLIQMLSKYSILPPYERGLCLTATDRPEIEGLLHVVLSEWIDFLFVPEPQSFAIYADHDEFLTLYTRSRVDLDRVVGPLSDQGFKMVANWERHF